MDDWEDNIFDYSNYPGEKDFEEDFEDFDTERFTEDDPFISDDIMKEDSIDFNPDFKQMQQLIGDKNRGTTLLPGASKRAQKSMRSAEDVIKDQLRGVLSSDMYSNISDAKKNDIVSSAERLKNISLLNLEILVQALIWKMSGNVLNKKNYAEFTKKYSVEDQVSLLLYIRMLD